MLAIGKKLGFSIESDVEDGDNELSIHFEKSQRFDGPGPDHIVYQGESDALCV